MTEISPAEKLFFAALEQANDSERAAYLDAACAGDSAYECEWTSSWPPTTGPVDFWNRVPPTYPYPLRI